MRQVEKSLFSRLLHEHHQIKVNVISTKDKDIQELRKHLGLSAADSEVTLNGGGMTAKFEEGCSLHREKWHFQRQGGAIRQGHR